MSAETLKACAARLRQFEEDAGGDVEMYVEIEQDDYEVDLGVFGYQSMSVQLVDEYYSINIGEVLDGLPMQRGDFEYVADELERIAENLDGGEKSPLDKLLSELENTPGTVRQVHELRQNLARIEEAAKKALADARHDPLAMLPS